MSLFSLNPVQVQEQQDKKSRKSRHKSVYIVKPSEGSQGDGIYLLKDPQQYISNGRSHVVQEYCANVLLIDK